MTHLDQLYLDVPADVLGTELDMCWVTVGGAEPCGYLEKICRTLPSRSYERFPPGEW